MKRHAWFVVAICLCSLYGPPLALARHPDLLRNYRFVPPVSSLGVTGGIAGFDLELSIHGTFGLVTGYRDVLSDKVDSFPTFRRYAQFVEVDAQGINPADFGPYTLDLDKSINLSNLRGAPGPLMLPLENWQFNGVDGQGAPMNLLVIEVGRWLAMFGSNDAPCCDYFNYEIQAVARQVPFADFDNDGDSDRHDLIRLETHLGVMESALLEQGDSDADGDVDGQDFLNLQRDYGDSANTAIALAQSALASATLAVPEPTSSLLALLAATCLLTRRRS